MPELILGRVSEVGNIRAAAGPTPVGGALPGRFASTLGGMGVYMTMSRAF